jgi:hypothetical protein
MKFIRRALAACLLCATAWASAADLYVDGSISPGFDLDTYSFRLGAGDSGRHDLDLFETVRGRVAPPTLPNIVFGLVKETDHGLGWQLIDLGVGAGTLSFYAGAGLYQAFVGGFNFSGHQVPYRLQLASVSAVPEPQSWALLLVGLGCIVYQLRRRRPPPSWGVQSPARPRA